MNQANIPDPAFITICSTRTELHVTIARDINEIERYEFTMRLPRGERDLRKIRVAAMKRMIDILEQLTKDEEG